MPTLKKNPLTNTWPWSQICEGYYGRYDLTKPFLHEGRLYAGNRALMVRIDQDYFNKLPEMGKPDPLPPVKDLLWDRLGSRHPWPRLAQLERPRVCDWCNGSGREEDDEDEDYCAAQDFGPCHRCGGRKWLDYPRWIRVHNRLIAGHYAKVIQKLPDVVYVADMFTPAGDDCEVSLAFNWCLDGNAYRGQGLIMPLHEE